MARPLRVAGSAELRAESPTRMAMRHFARNRTAMVALGVAVALTGIALCAKWIAPHDPLTIFPGESLKPPNSSHLMGTDLVGRDVLSRVIHGARVSLLVGIVSVSVSAAGGVLLGLLAGYYAGLPDSAIMRFIDMLLAFPGILLALTIVSFLGTGLINVMIAVGISMIPIFARLVRGSVLSVKENLYVEAAECVGCGHSRIMFRHILPNALAPVLVLASLAYGWSILYAASLSFLGLGAQPPTPEWGLMISDGRGFLREAPWLTIFPGLAIMTTVLSANLIGDALRDALDPRLRL